MNSGHRFKTENQKPKRISNPKSLVQESRQKCLQLSEQARER